MGRETNPVRNPKGAVMKPKKTQKLFWEGGKGMQEGSKNGTASERLRQQNGASPSQQTQQNNLEARLA